MTSRHKRELEQLFLELCDADTIKRKVILDQQFAVKDEKRQQLEALLAVNQSTPDILRQVPELGRAALAELVTTTQIDDASPAKGALLGTGERVANYTILDMLSHSGMSVVYLAKHDVLPHRLVALKWLPNIDGDHVRRFLREGNATDLCRHDNIVVLHEMGVHDGHPYIVFEYLRGKTLRQWMAEQAWPLSRAQVRDIILPVMRALMCAHALDVVHRDLKPENIMITESNDVKVLDFGIAKMLSNQYATTISVDMADSLTEQTQRGILIGTPPYMSPEQWGADSIDYRTDIWAVGILLHELVTGRHPLDPLDRARLHSVLDLDLPMPPVTDVPPGLEGFVDIIHGCLVKRKRYRIQTASELYGRLLHVCPPDAGGSRAVANDTEPAPATPDNAREGTVPGHRGPAPDPFFREMVTALLLSSELPVNASLRDQHRPRACLEGFRILCVDDEHESRSHLERSLGVRNHVKTAANAYEALEQLSVQSFDIMIADENMPGLTGTQLAMQVGTRFPGLPIVLLTGFDDNPEVMDSLRSASSPVIDVMAKPVNTAALEERILDACDVGFGLAVRKGWRDYWATLPVLLECRRIIRGFTHKFGTNNVFETALREKMMECVHGFARNVTLGEPGYQAAASLRTSLVRIRQLMVRVHVGKSQGLAKYLESMTKDFSVQWPHIALCVDAASPFAALDGLADIQTLLILGAIELVDNAREALGACGQIRVQLEKLACSHAVVLKVCNNGPAIPAEIAARLFEEGVSTKGPGRGIGLAIVKGLARFFQGEVRLLQHEGVSFLMTVPLPDEAR